MSEAEINPHLKSAAELGTSLLAERRSPGKKDAARAVELFLNALGAPGLASQAARKVLENFPETNRAQVSRLCDELDIELASEAKDQEKIAAFLAQIEGLLVQHAEIMVDLIAPLRGKIVQLAVGQADLEATVSDGVTALTKGQHEILKGIRELLGERARLSSSSLIEGPGGSPAKELLHFTGREAEMQHLEELVNASEGKDDFILVTGMGGSGKSALVNQFIAKRGKELFPKGVYWIRANAMEQDTRRVAKQLGWLEGMDIQPADYLRRELEGKEDKGFLVVIDGLSVGHASEAMSLPIVRGATLVTSTEPHLASNLNLAATPLELDTWEPEESRTYLKGASEQCKTQTDDDLDTLSRFVGHLPLGVNLIAKLMDANRREPIGETRSERLLKKLKSQGLGALDAVAKGAVRSVAQTFMASWEALSEPSEDKIALSALQVCSKEASFAALQAASGLSEYELEDALGRLEAASLVHYDETTNRYLTHDVIRLFVSKQSAEEMKTDGKREALIHNHIAWVTEHLGDKNGEFFQAALVESNRIVDHAMELLDNEPEKASEIVEAIYSSLIDTGIYYAEALRLAETFLSRLFSQEKEPGSKPSSKNAGLKAKWLKEKGISQLFLGENEGAHKSLEEGIAMIEKDLEGNLETLAVLRIKKAEALLRKLMKQKNAHKEPDKTGLYANQKPEYETCLKLCNDVIALYELNPGLNPIYLAEAYSKRAVTQFRMIKVLPPHRARGTHPLIRSSSADGEVALNLLKRHLQELEKEGNMKAYRDVSLELASMYVNDLADISPRMAPEYFENALDICLKQAGREHLRTIYCYEKMAYYYYNEGKTLIRSDKTSYQKALNSVDQAIDIAKVVYKDIPLRLANLYILASKISTELGNGKYEQYATLAQTIIPGIEIPEHSPPPMRARGGGKTICSVK